MQTFLPYADFRQSLECLDDKRLGKQRVEAFQILCTLTGVSAGWRKHPAVRQWRGYENALTLYMNLAIETWVNRGFRNTMKLERVNLPNGCALYFPAQELLATNGMLPLFVGTEAFHASHRSNLLRKDLVFYSQYGWTELPTLPYVWGVDAVN